MSENVPSVWNERANNGKPVRTTASLLVLSVNDASIFPTRTLRLDGNGRGRRSGRENLRDRGPKYPYPGRWLGSTFWGSAFLPE